jgi:DNA-binding MarR family transcriptional regulator
MDQDSANIHLTQDLFQLFKRLPHLRLNVQPIKGLTNSEHELLVVLRFNTIGEKTMLSASEITGLLHITSSGGTHLFNPLEKAGFITRMQDPRDRRITLIGLTEKGIETTNALLTDIHEQFSGLIDYLGEDDSKTFIRLVTMVFDYFASQPTAQNESGIGRYATQAYS